MCNRICTNNTTQLGGARAFRSPPRCAQNKMDELGALTERRVGAGQGWTGPGLAGLAGLAGPANWIGTLARPWCASFSFLTCHWLRFGRTRACDSFEGRENICSRKGPRERRARRRSIFSSASKAERFRCPAVSFSGPTVRHGCAPGHPPRRWPLRPPARPLALGPARRLSACKAHSVIRPSVRPYRSDARLKCQPSPTDLPQLASHNNFARPVARLTPPLFALPAAPPPAPWPIPAPKYYSMLTLAALSA